MRSRPQNRFAPSPPPAGSRRHTLREIVVPLVSASTLARLCPHVAISPRGHAAGFRVFAEAGQGRYGGWGAFHFSKGSAMRYLPAILVFGAAGTGYFYSQEGLVQSVSESWLQEESPATVSGPVDAQRLAYAPKEEVVAVPSPEISNFGKSSGSTFRRRR